MSEKPSPSDQGRFMEMIKKGRTSEVVRLLQEGAVEVNPQSLRGLDQPLCAASMYGHLEIAKVLLEQGANVKFLDPRSGASPLVGLGGSLTSRTTMLLAELLLAYGADVNSTIPGGLTPLNYIAHYGCGDVVRILLDAGADPSIQNIDRRDSEQEARYLGHPLVADYIRDYITAPPIREQPSVPEP